MRSLCFQENKLFLSQWTSQFVSGLFASFLNAYHAKSMHAWQHSILILCRYKLARSITITLIYININLSS